MYIEAVRLRNFRNYTNQIVQFKNGMNVLLGENGEGKTNLLESIYLLSTTRSHRNDDDRELIKFDTDMASVEGILRNSTGGEKLTAVIHPNGKTLMINNQPVKKTSDFIGRVNAVIFSPKDMDLFEGSPKVRRRLVDMELGKLSVSYMFNLSEYLKSLKERNTYLKKGKDPVMLETFTDMLYQPQIQIIKERAQFVRSLNAYLTYFYDQISGTDTKLMMVYRSFVQERNNEVVMLEQIKQAYKNIEERDIALGQTNIGIHREDFEFYLDGKNVEKYSSQGQKRMVILALKLAIVQIIFQFKREYPIVLLDDVFSELDSKRRVSLMRLLPNSIQTIITTTDGREVGLLRNQNANVVFISKGTVVNGRI